MSNTILKGINKNKHGHWSQGLIFAMNDPNSIYNEDDLTVTIKDKYPKARHHYLILCKEDISRMSKLNESHLPLLLHMFNLAMKLKSKLNVNCKIGFHSKPSMNRLHLHIISDDFISPYLKTKHHWNTFTTDFFVSLDDVVKTIKENGSPKILCDSDLNELLKSPIKCHKCKYNPKTMTDLKNHLLSHE